MSEDDAGGDAAPIDGLVEEYREEMASRSTKERVYAVVSGLEDPATVSEIAERADCSDGGARSNLDWFADLGVVSKVAENPNVYARNEAYFDFLRVNRVAEEYTARELDAEIEAYEEREERLAASFDVPNPADVDLTEFHDDFEDAADRLSEWRTVRRRLSEFRRARHRLEDSDGPGRHELAL